jgi:hypothetical protein
MTLCSASVAKLVQQNCKRKSKLHAINYGGYEVYSCLWEWGETESLGSAASNGATVPVPDELVVGVG